MARRHAALLVTSKWDIDVARRHSALLVTSKGKIDVARRGATLLVRISTWQGGTQPS